MIHEGRERYVPIERGQRQRAQENATTNRLIDDPWRYEPVMREFLGLVHFSSLLDHQTC